METDKFEKHIKAQFKDREIQPSESAWAKISSELNSDSSKKKPVYLWMSIAASVIVLLGITLFYFNGSNELNEVQFEVVDTNSESTSKAKKATSSVSIQEKEQETVVQNDIKADELKKVNSVEGKKQELNTKKEYLNIDDKIEVAFTKNEIAEKEPKKIEISESIINDKLAEVVAQIDVMEQYNSVSDAEIDSLLQRAQDEILRDKIFNTDKSVDAMALLTEVEDELDQSFRDQIFNSLKAGFIKVRTAVADRNN